jgi:hypothetical protein
MYVAKFPRGTSVRIQERGALDLFFKEWSLHDPLTPEQLAWAGRTATVESTGFYHGGDVLYVLADVPGIWHERCLLESGQAS